MNHAYILFESVTRQGRTNESEIKSFKMIIKTVLGC
jgi:hypothetical protein